METFDTPFNEPANWTEQLYTKEQIHIMLMLIVKAEISYWIKAVQTFLKQSQHFPLLQKIIYIRPWIHG